MLFAVRPVSAAPKQDYKRIISCGSFVTEALYRLGAENKVVGVTTYCLRPPQAQEKPKIGDIVEVNLEKVIALKPDVVITTPLTDPRAVAKMRSLGINAITLGQVKNFEQICAQFIRLGRISGEKEKAERIVAREKKVVRGLISLVKGRPSPKVFIQVGTKPLFTMNKNFFINDLIHKAGAVNIAENAHSGIYSREKVVAEDPDVIVFGTMGAPGKDEKKSWMKYKNLRAVRKNRIFVVDPYIICSPTPDNFAAALKKMVYFLYGIKS